MNTADESHDIDVPARRGDVEWVELDGEAVLYDAATHTLHQLNASSAAVWAACDGGTSSRGISRTLEESYSGLPDEIARDVRAVIRRLRRLNLLQRSPAEAGRRL